MISTETLSLIEQFYSRGQFIQVVELAESYLYAKQERVANAETVRVLVMLGNARTFQTEYVAGLECLRTAIELATPLDNPALLATAHNALGYLYLTISEFEKAEQNLEISRKLLEKSDPLLGVVLLNLSIVELNTNNAEEASSLCAKAVEILQRNNNIRSLGYAHLNFSKVFARLRNTPEALAAVDSAIECFNKVEDKLGLGQSLGWRGHLAFSNLADQKVRQIPPNILHDLLRGQSMLEEVGAKKYLSDIHSTLAAAYESVEDWRKSYEHQKQFSLLQNELQSIDVAKKTAVIEAELSLDLAKKNAELSELRNGELRNANEQLERALRDLRENEQQLVQAEKMASLGQLTAGIAHELNNPIGFIGASLLPLKRDISYLINTYLPENQDDVVVELKEEIESLLRAIEDGAKRTSDIVKGLRTFSRLDEHELKLTDIHEGIDATLILLRSKIGDAITIHKNYGPIPKIMCLPGPLNQVFMNILVNAIQAIQGPGTITITTSQQADNVLVSIRDTGGGISDELINRIFEPFFTTKPIGVGTGLGLSICYDIIKKNNGDITVQSKIGVGTEFIITLPLQQ